MTFPSRRTLEEVEGYTLTFVPFSPITPRSSMRNAANMPRREPPIVDAPPFTATGLCIKLGNQLSMAR